MYFLEKPDQIFIIKKLAKQLGIKLKFKKMPPQFGGNFHIPTQTITLNSEWPSSLLNVFFHEVGHWHAKNTGKFKVFHAGRIPVNEREFRIYAATALRAELWVDAWGRNLMAQIFPDMYYSRSYTDGGARGFLDYQIEMTRQAMKKPPPMIRRVERYQKRHQKQVAARNLFLKTLQEIQGDLGDELVVVVRDA